MRALKDVEKREVETLLNAAIGEGSTNNMERENRTKGHGSPTATILYQFRRNKSSRKYNMEV